MIFKIDYAKYYNLLYSNKDYEGEANYINQLIEINFKDGKSILDIGCGTGRHAKLLAEKGYKVSGVDLSEEMINIAKGNYEKIKNLDFHVSSVQDLQLDKKFDIVTSLFHVMSYQTANKMLLSAFKNINKHLKPGGIFVFDFWYGPGVLTEQPTSRTLNKENEDYVIKRVSYPTLKVNDNVVDVRFKVSITDKKTSLVEEIEELHPMRYFFYPELKMLLENTGFSILSFSEWLSKNRSPELNTWNSVIVAKKKL